MPEYLGGFIREPDFTLDVTTDATGAGIEGGYLRAPTGELVVTTDATGATMQGGFLRAPNWALVVEQGNGTYESGYTRTASGALAVSGDPGTMQAGFLRDAEGDLVVIGLATQAIAWTGEGTTTTVTDVATLTSALAAASTGDTIELADGTYDFTAPIFVNTNGIRVKAANPKGAVLRGSATAPTAANAETTPAHVVYGLRVRGDDVFIEDLHFQYFGIGLDLDSILAPVVQGCRFESCFDSGCTAFDVGTPRVHMNEFLDPYLAGDLDGTLTTRGVSDAQMDYGIDLYGCTNPRVTHNYFHGIMNQCLSFKEGNQNPYAGYNTFEGAAGNALFFGQNVPGNGPYETSGLPTGVDFGDLVAEYNVFRPVKSAAGQTYRMGAAIRVWHVDGDTVLRGNVIECAGAGIKIEGTDAGVAAGTVLLDGNLIGGSWHNVAGSPIDVASYGLAFNSGVTAVITMQDTTFINHYDTQDVTFQPNRNESTGTPPAPSYTETGTTRIEPEVGDLTLALPMSTFDPYLGFPDPPPAELAYAHEVLADNPVGFWKLNDTTATAADSSGHGRDGTYEGAVTRGTAGLVDGGTAATFAGGGVALADAAKLALTVGTIEAWINTSNGDNNYHAIFAKPGAFSLNIKAAFLQSFDYSGGGDQWGPATGLDDGLRHHVAFTFQSGVVGGSQFYLDGQPVGTPVTITVANQSGVAHIGSDGATRPFDGVIDDVAVYDTVLSAARILAHFNAG